MLEIFGIMWLCNKNKANALKRGRKPGGFIALTLALWLGLELLGGIIGGASGLGFGAYLLALCMAIIGGLISYAVAQNCKPGQYVSPQQQMASAIVQTAEPLVTPAQIWVVRDSSMVGALVHWDFTLNGQPIGSLGNGSHLNAVAASRQNILAARDAYGTEVAPFVFDAPPGGMIEIHFKANKFLPEQSRGFLPPTQPTSAAQMPVAPAPVPTQPASGGTVSTSGQVPSPAVSEAGFVAAVPPAAAVPDAEAGVHAGTNAVPVQRATGFCMQCGTVLIPGSDVCPRCGAKRFVQNTGDAAQPVIARVGVQPAAVACPAPTGDVLPVSPVPPAGQPAANPPVPQMAGATAAAAGCTAPQRQTATALLPQSDTMRAIWTGVALVISWMLFWLIQGLFKDSPVVNHDTGHLLTIAMVGVAVYLVIQNGVRDWIAGGVLAFLSVCMASFNRYIFLMITHGEPEFSFHCIVDGLILLRTALVIGLAVLLAYLARKQNKPWFFSSAGAAAGIYFLFQLIQAIRMFWLPDSLEHRAADVAVRFIVLLARTAILWLAIQFARRLALMPRTPVRLRGAGLVWAWLVVVGMSLSLLSLLLIRRNPVPMTDATGILLALLGATGYILLLCHKRIGLYVLLAGIGLMLTAQFVNNLSHHLYGARQYAPLWIGSLIGGVNPLLGWLSVRSADRRDAAEQMHRMQMPGAAPAFAFGTMPPGMPPAFGTAPFPGAAQMPGMAPPFAAYAPYVQPAVRPVSGFQKFTAIFNLVTGAFWTLFPIPFMVTEKLHWSMFLVVFFGILLGGSGIWCFVRQRSRQKAYPTWMRVVSLVFFIFSALVLLAFLIGIVGQWLR